MDKPKSAKLDKIDEKSNKILSNYSDELNIIQNMWEDLGLNQDYKNIFLNIVTDLDITTCKELLDFELGSLRKFADALSVLFKL